MGLSCCAALPWDGTHLAQHTWHLRGWRLRPGALGLAAQVPHADHVLSSKGPVPEWCPARLPRWAGIQVTVAMNSDDWGG